MNTCTRCLQTRRRSFFRDGVCDVCDPSIAPEKGAFPLSYVTAMAQAFVREGGVWVTAAEARDKGTRASPLTIRELYDAGHFDRTLPGADECDTWLRSLAHAPESSLSDYECSLALLARKGTADSSEFALAASAYHAWKKTIGPTDTASAPTGQWLGAIKERIVIHGCHCKGILSLGVNKDFPERGCQFLITFTAASGHDLKWFTGEGTKFDPKVGEVYDIKATIKAFDEYKGHRSTVVSRCAENK